MGLDRQKALKEAEKLLAQGKNERAVESLKELLRSVGNDPLTVNRIGDTLARHGLSDEAKEVYLRLGKQYAESGFLPKAVAIYKKIHRLEPDDLEVTRTIGELYLRQKLPGEARGYLMAVVERSVEDREFDGAAKMLRELAEAEPDVAAHRARLAETLAAAGDQAAAARELVVLGQQLLDRDEAGEAETAFARARQLAPDDPAAMRGISRAMSQLGREDEALTLLQGALEGETDADADAVHDVLGELLVRHEQGGRFDESLELLKREDASEIPASYYRDVFSHHLDQGTAPAVWDRYSQIFNRWSRGEHEDRLLKILQALTTIEAEGHIPALQWLIDLLKARNDRPGIGRTLERLIGAYQARCMVDEASMMLEHLRKIAPNSPLLQEDGIGEGSSGLPLSEVIEDTPAAPAGAAAPAPAKVSADEPVDLDREAPAVPIDKSDEAFVTGRLTQSEILEKYGLASQAVAQLKEIVERFPGHVESQERLVLLLRSQGETADLARALAGLAFATRAAGDIDAAQNAAEEALQTGSLETDTLEALRQRGVLQASDTLKPLASAPAAESAAPPPAAASVAASSPSAPTPAPAAGADDADLVIDFDADGPADTPATAGDSIDLTPDPVAPAAGGALQADALVLADVRQRVDAGQLDAAQAQLDMLKQIGYGGPELEALEQRVEQARGALDVKLPEAATAAAVPEPAAPAPPTAAPAGTNGNDELLDDDDLAALTRALESEVFEEPGGQAAEPDETEQSVEDVLAQFREKVSEQVDDEDFRTRYDLGIAFMEMGLIDQAIEEFELAVRSPDKERDSCVMIARCHASEQRTDDALGWYRKALSAAGGDEDTAASLRYELAECLQNTGANDEALDIFRAVLQASPGYRDVADRVATLESRQER